MGKKGMEMETGGEYSFVVGGDTIFSSILLPLSICLDDWISLYLPSRHLAHFSFIVFFSWLPFISTFVSVLFWTVLSTF
jgi:hypothetical protein